MLPENLRRRIRMDLYTRCWIWQGATAKGYGRVKVKGRVVSVHRLVYELLVGPIPEGLTIDHTCGNPLCCSPRHLEPVTLAENLRRARGGDTCRRGHPWTAENTYRYPNRPQRLCRTCHREGVYRRRSGISTGR